MSLNSKQNPLENIYFRWKRDRNVEEVFTSRKNKEKVMTKKICKNETESPYERWLYVVLDDNIIVLSILQAKQWGPNQARKKQKKSEKWFREWSYFFSEIMVLNVHEVHVETMLMALHHRRSFVCVVHLMDKWIGELKNNVFTWFSSWNQSSLNR